MGADVNDSLQCKKGNALTLALTYFLTVSFGGKRILKAIKRERASERTKHNISVRFSNGGYSESKFI